MKYFVFFTMISFYCFAQTKRTIGGVRLSSHWEGETKVFSAEVEMIYEADLKTVAEGIENFDEKCNNEYRSKRKKMKWDDKCLYFNKNLVEAIKIHNFNKDALKTDDLSPEYLVWRNIYNRGSFAHYDVIKKKTTPEVMIISHEMINPEVIGKVLPKPTRIKSAFDYMKGTYKLIKVAENKTKVKYRYESKTSHWFLVRDFVEENVFENMSAGTIQALKTITKAVERNSRSL
jgi:hypothetical protein